VELLELNILRGTLERRIENALGQMIFVNLMMEYGKEER